MNKIVLCVLITMLASEFMADNGDHHEDSIIVLEEYPGEKVYVVSPVNERIKKMQAMYARGEVVDFKENPEKRNVDIINSLLALPKGIHAAGRRR